MYPKKLGLTARFLKSLGKCLFFDTKMAYQLLKEV